ncbi:hypothetical protein M0811_11463 [Anaeramoeba ignava]|uniref:Uncharacterized protein n=1 Tax=Anaeramoeba ignava TaxID=1746090 RepID=A0A9Q0LBC9_ANAIG|nr:hypothetical protein M0811_11463 [Anaeramoeba ignava]
MNFSEKGNQTLENFINQISNLNEKSIEETIKYMKQCPNNYKIQEKENGCFILKNLPEKMNIIEINSEI